MTQRLSEWWQRSWVPCHSQEGHPWIWHHTVPMSSIPWAPCTSKVSDTSHLKKRKFHTNTLRKTPIFPQRITWCKTDFSLQSRQYIRNMSFRSYSDLIECGIHCVHEKYPIRRGCLTYWLTCPSPTSYISVPGLSQCQVQLLTRFLLKQRLDESPFISPTFFQPVQ